MICCPVQISCCPFSNASFTLFQLEVYQSLSLLKECLLVIVLYRVYYEIEQIRDFFRNLESATRKLEERQQRAKELRQMLQEEKARRLRELSNKVFYIVAFFVLTYFIWLLNYHI